MDETEWTETTGSFIFEASAMFEINPEGFFKAFHTDLALSAYFIGSPLTHLALNVDS